MNLLVTGSSIRGLPVVTIGGEDVAEVRDLIYDAHAGRLIGFTLNKRGAFSGRLDEVLTIDRVRAIGRDAVMIADRGQLTAPDSASSEVGSADHDRDVTRNDVLTESGVSLGEVRDIVVLAGTSGEMVGYQVELPSGASAYIPLPAQLAVSGDALVVPDATADFVRDDLVGLGAAVDEFRARLGLT